MLTERLQVFIRTWLDQDGDPAEVTEILRSGTRADFAGWLQDDLRAAIQGPPTGRKADPRNCFRNRSGCRGMAAPALGDVVFGGPLPRVRAT